MANYFSFHFACSEDVSQNALILRCIKWCVNDVKVIIMCTLNKLNMNGISNLLGAQFEK